MATEVGSAYGRLGLNIDELRTNFGQAKAMLLELRELMQPMVANMQLRVPTPQQQQQTSGAVGTGAAGQTAQAAAAAQVANAAGKAASAVAGLTREEERAEEQAIRVAVAQQNWSVALAKLEQAELLHGKSQQFVTNLALLRAQAEKGNNALTDAQAVSNARAAASVFEYGKAQTFLSDILADTTITQERRLALQRELDSITTKSIANTNAAADAERQRLTATIQGSQEALRRNQAAQVGLAPTDPRRIALMREEMQLSASLEKSQQQLAAAHIKGAIDAKSFGQAIALIQREMAASSNDAVRLIELRNQLARVTDLERQAGDKLADTYRKQVIANQGLKTAITQNRQDFSQAPQGPQGDTRRMQLDKELLVLQRQLDTQNKQLADSEIALARASGQHIAALQIINRELITVGVTQTRYNQLMKTGHAILNEHNSILDTKAIRDAKAAAAAGEFAKAENILNTALSKILPTSERRVALSNALAQTQRQATAAANQYSDAVTQQYKQLGLLHVAQQKITAELAQTAKGSQREIDLKNQLIQVNKAIIGAEIAYFRALGANQAQQKQYANSMAALEQAQQRTTVGSKEWLRIQTQINQVMGQSHRQDELLADAKIRAARAARNYSEALRLINQQLGMTIPGTTRYNNLLAQQSQVTNQATGMLNRIKASFAGYAAGFLGAAAAMRAFGAAKDYILGGVSLVATLQEQERGVSAVLNSVNRGNQVLKDAITFGQRYGFTQKEMGEAASQAAILMQTSATSAEETFSVLARLQARAPGKTFNDAVRSIAELQAGQLQSIQRVFNVPARFAQEMRDAIESGIDPIKAVDVVLTRLGQTNAVLDARNQGLSRSFRDLAIESESLKREIGEVAAGPVQELTDAFAENAQRARDVIHGMRNIEEATPRERMQAFVDMFKNYRTSDSQWYGPIIRGFEAIGAAGNAAEKRLNASGKGIELSLEDLRKHAEKTAPYLASIGVAADKPLTDLETRLRANATQINALSNRYAQAQIGAIEFARSLNEINDANGRMVQAEDTFGWVQQINDSFPSAKDRAQEVDAALIALNATIGAAPNSKVANQYIPQLKALANEAIRLKALSPIELEIEIKIKNAQLMRDIGQRIIDEGVALTADLQKIDQDYATSSEAMQNEHMLNRIAAQNQIRDLETTYATDRLANETAFGNQRRDAASRFARETVQLEQTYGRERVRAALDFAKQMAQAEAQFAQQRARAIRDFGIQATRSERDYGQQRAKAIRDFGLQMARSERDFNQQLQRSLRDFNMQSERAQRDFNRQEARTQEEQARQLAEGRKQLQKDDAQALREHLRNLQRMQRDYEIDRLRSTEDFELERAVLLAEGRIAEAQVLASRFAVEQRRNAEDFSRGRSDAGDDFSRGRGDAARQLEEQERETAEANERARLQRLADFELQRQDAAAAFALQLADSKAARQQQIADANAAFALQQQDAAEAHAQQRADAAAAFALQQADAAAAHEQQKQAAIAAFAEQERDAATSHANMLAERISAYKREDAVNTAQHVLERLANKIAHDAELQQLKDANRAREQQEAFDRVEAWKARQAEYGARLKEYDKFVTDQTALFDKAMKEQAAIADLVAQGVNEDMAAMRVEMANSAEFLAKTFAEVDRLTTSAGAKAALAYLEGLTRTLRDNAKTNMEIGLGPYANNMQTKSPIKEGPLKDHHLSAQRVGKMYAEGIRIGLLAGQGEVTTALNVYKHAMDTQVDTYKELLTLSARNAQIPRNASDPHYVAGGVRAEANRTAWPTRPTQINIQLTAPVTMDGKTVGTIVAPFVSEVFSDDLTVAANVTNAVFTPGVSQSAFRKP